MYLRYSQNPCTKNGYVLFHKSFLSATGNQLIICAVIKQNESELAKLILRYSQLKS